MNGWNFYLIHVSDAQMVRSRGTASKRLLCWRWRVAGFIWFPHVWLFFESENQGRVVALPLVAGLHWIAQLGFFLPTLSTQIVNISSPGKQHFHVSHFRVHLNEPLTSVPGNHVDRCHVKFRSAFQVIGIKNAGCIVHSNTVYDVAECWNGKEFVIRFSIIPQNLLINLNYLCSSNGLKHSFKRTICLP